MTSINITDLKTVKAQVEVAQSLNQRPSRPLDDSNIIITRFHDGLTSILGDSPQQTLLLTSLTSSQNHFFQSGCVFQPVHNELWTTSGPLQTRDSSALPVILISKIALAPDSHKPGGLTSLSWQKLRPPAAMSMPACGATYKDGVIWAAQGILSPQTAGLVYLRVGKPPSVFVRDYYGRDFNSPYDVAVAQDGAIWFTDPANGATDGWRPKPTLPPRIYRFVPESGEIRAMADELDRPMGIAISPDQSTLYVANSIEYETNQENPPFQSTAVYAFDIVTRSGSTFLTTRRLFAAPLHGAPTCVRCDRHNNVWVASGNHVEIWSSGAVLLGVIEVPSAVTSLCLGEAEDVFIGAGHTLWRVESG